MSAIASLSDRSELNPQCELTYAASSSVTGASGGDLPKIAISQIVPRIIEVYMVGNVGEATVEL